LPLSLELWSWQSIILHLGPVSLTDGLLRWGLGCGDRLMLTHDDVCLDAGKRAVKITSKWKDYGEELVAKMGEIKEASQQLIQQAELSHMVNTRQALSFVLESKNLDTVPPVASHL
jgi:hypothetical protein